MRNALPLVLIVLAAVGGWWLVTAAEDDLPAPGIEPGDEPTPDAAAGALESRGMKAEGLATKGTPRPVRRAPASLPDPRALPKGNLVVSVLGPDLKPLVSGDLRVRVDPVTYAAWRTRLGHYDKERRAWRFQDVVAGTVRVHIQGDHVVARTIDAVVKRDRDSEVSVVLDLAGAIRYDVIAYDKTRPDPVKLTLYDYRNKPVRAWYEERTSRRLTTAKLLATAEIGPEGVVFGILPGRYRLRVVSPAEEWDEAEVDVVAGKTVPLSLEVRR